MNIVYTINGEGMGHATRSSVIIDHLLSKGHKVFIFGSGRPLAFLKQKFGTIAEVTSLHMVYEDNKVQRLRTALRALSNLNDIRKDLTTIRRSLANFKSDVVITDFDFHGPIIARLHKVPLISIDNIQFLTQAEFHVESRDIVDYELNYAVAKMMVPSADYYFITTFAEALLRHPEKSANIFFVPPLLRKKILETKSRDGEHILVYQTADSYDDLLSILSQSKEHFVVYNCGQRKKASNVLCKDFNEDSFIADLASAKAVIMNGGFNVITESLYFKKPILSVPIKSFYEQRLNGLLLQKMGLGMMANRLSKSVLKDFINRRDSFRAVAGTVRFDNEILFSKLDTVLASLPTKHPL